jgi:hypothetical protein
MQGSVTLHHFDRITSMLFTIAFVLQDRDRKLHGNPSSFGASANFGIG